MTTKVLEIAKIHTYFPLENRIRAMESASKGVHPKHPEFSIENYTMSMFYHLLLEQYAMPRNLANEFINLCRLHDVTVTELGALLDEELFEKMGYTPLSEVTLSYVSLAILEHFTNKGGHKATKELKHQLMPPKKKPTQTQGNT